MPSRRRILAAVVAAEIAGTLSFAVAPRIAHADASFDVVNGTANATAVYAVYFTGQFSNFSPGLIGSSFPLSHTHLDNSPFAEGTSSPADTGPAGGLVVADYNTTPPPVGPQTISQPQYAEARYPGGAKQSAFGSAPGPYATATASGGGATANSGVVDTTATQNPSSPAMRHAFDQAMAQWRARYMSPLATTQHPAASTDPTAPDGVDGDTASTSSVLDPAKGVVTLADARVTQASFGGGALVLHGVHSAVSITNNGTPQATVTTTVADASVGGVPVSIGTNGVTVGPQTVPLDQVQAASQQLNAALAAAGIQVSAISGTIVQSAAEETVTQSAVTVIVDQPGPPEQKVEYSLGNIFVDNLAMPSPPPVSLGSVDTGLGGYSAASTLTPPQVSAVPAITETTPPPPASSGSPATATPAPSRLIPLVRSAARGPKPTWLLVAYLLWQMLMVATLASLWWWRSTARRLRLPGAPS